MCFFSVLEQAETLKNVEVLGKKRDCVERTRKQQFYVRIKCGKSGMSYEQIDAKVMPPVLSMSPMLALRNAVLFVTLVLLQNGGGRSDDVKTKYASGVQHQALLLGTKSSVNFLPSWWVSIKTFQNEVKIAVITKSASIFLSKFSWLPKSFSKYESNSFYYSKILTSFSTMTSNFSHFFDCAILA